jgi:2-polyprenyl-3-methyl-5-hydroxy-6-metoxy-1,4-benzoquinol methylase
MQKVAGGGKLMFLLCAQFFKDRHYLDKEWGHYIGGKVEEAENATCNSCNKVVLEVGCGVGNTIFPLLAEFPQIFLHACDFSPRAVNLVKVCILELYRNLLYRNPTLVDLCYDYDLWNLILVRIRFCLKSHDMTLLC